jgi:hypothetical protein
MNRLLPACYGDVKSLETCYSPSSGTDTEYSYLMLIYNRICYKAFISIVLPLSCPCQIAILLTDPDPPVTLPVYISRLHTLRVALQVDKCDQNPLGKSRAVCLATDGRLGLVLLWGAPNTRVWPCKGLQ